MHPPESLSGVNVPGACSYYWKHFCLISALHESKENKHPIEIVGSLGSSMFELLPK